MNKSLVSLLAGLVVSAVAPTASAAVEYVKVCTLYGDGFHYIAGTDICLNDMTGDARQQTEGGTWRTQLPYPTGNWVTDIKHECGPGKPVKLGTYTSTDFELNVYQRKQTQEVPLLLKSDELVTKVIMSGGFYNPLTPIRTGSPAAPGTLAFCVRQTDPDTPIEGPNGPIFPRADNTPIGCVANSRIVNMPAAYAVAATYAYPSIVVNQFHNEEGELVTTEPVLWGTRLLITTDIGAGGERLLMYSNDGGATLLPLAGTLTVSVCVDKAGKK